MTAVTMHHFSGLSAPFVRSKGTVSGGVFRVISFHPETGSQYLAFHSRELFLRCIDQYTARQYRYQ